MCPRGICAVIKHLSSLVEGKCSTQIWDRGLQLAMEPCDVHHKCSSGAQIRCWSFKISSDSGGVMWQDRLRRWCLDFSLTEWAIMQLLQGPNIQQKAELEVNGQIVPETKLKAHFWIPLMSSEKSEEQNVRAETPSNTQVFNHMLWFTDHPIVWW